MYKIGDLVRDIDDPNSIGVIIGVSGDIDEYRRHSYTIYYILLTTHLGLCYNKHILQGFDDDFYRLEF